MLKWENWLHGLVSGFIGGASSAGSAFLGMAGAKAVGIDIHVLNWKEFGIVMLTSGISSALFYLKTSPLPAAGGDTKFITKDQTKQ